MKLLYIANARIPTPRAYGLQIMKTLEAFSLAGVQVELVVPTRKAQSFEDPFDYYNVQNRFPITTLPVGDFLSWGPLGFLVSAFLFARKVQSLPVFKEADVLYSRDALVLLNYLARGRTIVFEAHAKPSLVSRIVARHATRVVVISEGLRIAYEKVGVAANNIVVAPDAVDERLFDGAPTRDDARTMLGLPKDAAIALYAGHLYPRKGAGTLAEAAQFLPNVLCVFVGGTKEDVAAFRERWGHEPHIKIIGHIPHAQVPTYLRAANVLVLPNSAQNENAAQFTSPMKLFEYLASGTTIVASYVPAIREVLDENSAYLVNPDDPQALARGIEEALGDQTRAQRALSLSRNYTWGARVRVILAHL